mmetsp:Transcript_74449/g.150555  ORF Transcript_74449/g.150555 Transcript_74449/m.150555 type:complete len:237 (+) Transcript_74449:479-1189(+)
MASLGAPFGRGSRHSLLGSAQRLQGVGPFRDQEKHLPLIHQRWWGLVGRSARHLVAAACARESLALRSGGGQLPAGFRWFQCLGPAPCSRGTGVVEDSAAAGEELDQQAGGLRHSRGQRKWRGFAIGASQRWRSETPVPRGSSALAAVCAGLGRSSGLALGGVSFRCQDFIASPHHPRHQRRLPRHVHHSTAWHRRVGGKICTGRGPGHQSGLGGRTLRGVSQAVARKLLQEGFGY